MQFFQRENIDTNKWDQRIADDDIENIFCYSWYLDNTAKNWGALIEGDYNTIVPIPYTTLLGVKQMYQPSFTREIDIFGNSFNWTEVLEYLAKDFKAIHFRTQHSLQIDGLSERKHQFIELKDTGLKYSTNAKRLIKKADQIFNYKKDTDPNQLIELFKATAFQKIETLKAKDLISLEQLMKVAINNNKGDLIACYEQDTFVGAGFFFKDKGRITYLKGVASEEAKKNGAMFGLINFAIEQYKEDYNIFDFGGSEIEGVANFYKKFGATDRTYYNCEIDNLPVWYKTLKKIKG
ncbi:GNAT family N-acetyltransferase [Paracrocinitomix mangrovi]|uniref:GNAT family N-acetyltransferase n=1 Tax=Paracrocinitomix mangrovi TaxID=2862509 RepID=UPI001C8DAEF3|nr:GNAT family N-acetyltransferase [Paracrocinitomix mangrovi]UKN01377.1 GNAT family N-acetyltransferase [Paracrocinitomix mangrovi]